MKYKIKYQQAFIYIRFNYAIKRFNKWMKEIELI